MGERLTKTHSTNEENDTQESEAIDYNPGPQAETVERIKEGMDDLEDLLDELDQDPDFSEENSRKIILAYFQRGGQ